MQFHIKPLHLPLRFNLKYILFGHLTFNQASFSFWTCIPCVPCKVWNGCCNKFVSGWLLYLFTALDFRAWLSSPYTQWSKMLQLDFILSSLSAHCIFTVHGFVIPEECLVCLFFLFCFFSTQSIIMKSCFSSPPSHSNGNKPGLIHISWLERLFQIIKSICVFINFFLSHGSLEFISEWSNAMLSGHNICCCPLQHYISDCSSHKGLSKHYLFLH